ncbi:MAG: hypothetical protein CVU40_12090 [Chloroflexi bacterium HGW-Chloroflexi-2]|jgi:uncharacterized glyoxalase superfamily protein PhnB|nr:MAG: hypothetical protein CVU40_12090 [Chloroflexi bacterium HGW-Chloroflexi-2]
MGNFQPNSHNSVSKRLLHTMLSAGGMIIEPLSKAPWCDSFGMFVDKFGINWMVNIAGKPA